MNTYSALLTAYDIAIPNHLIADAEVPVLTVPQAQGDLLIEPVPANPVGLGELKPVPRQGIQLVRGEATGNTHYLHAPSDSPRVRWAPIDDAQIIAFVDIPDGDTAYVIHSDEHGSNGIGAGTYVIRRQREQADELHVVAD